MGNHHAEAREETRGSLFLRRAQSTQGLTILVWIMLVQNYLRELPAAIDAPSLWNWTRLGADIALVLLLTLPPSTLERRRDQSGVEL